MFSRSRDGNDFFFVPYVEIRVRFARALSVPRKARNKKKAPSRERETFAGTNNDRCCIPLSSTPTRSSSIGTRRKRWRSSTGWTSTPRSRLTRSWQGSSVSRRRITRAPSRGGRSSSLRCGRFSTNPTPLSQLRFVYVLLYVIRGHGARAGSHCCNDY